MIRNYDRYLRLSDLKYWIHNHFISANYLRIISLFFLMSNPVTHSSDMELVHSSQHPFSLFDERQIIEQMTNLTLDSSSSNDSDDSGSSCSLNNEPHKKSPTNKKVTSWQKSFTHIFVRIKNGIHDREKILLLFLKNQFELGKLPRRIVFLVSYLTMVSL